MKDLISIIIPVYNVEKYLEKCIESVINQTYRNLEIILIDDGSPDDCGAICEEYAKKDKRIIVVHKENGGVSEARNYGLNIATGDFIGFVDSDDYIEKNMYEKLYSEALKNGYDIIGCGFEEVNEVGETLKIQRVSELSKKDLKTSDFILENNMFGFVWNKIFKRKIISKYNIDFPEKTHLFEDSVFVFKYSIFADKICYIDENLYKYVKYNNSQQATSFYTTQYKSLSESKISFENILSFLKLHKKSKRYLKEIDKYFNVRFVKLGFSILIKNLLLGRYEEKRKNEFYYTIKKYRDFLSFKTKAEVFIRKIVLFFLKKSLLSRKIYKRRIKW